MYKRKGIHHAEIQAVYAGHVQQNQHKQGAHAEHQSRGIPPPEKMCIRDSLNLFPGKKPGNWEVYDIVKDPAEKNDIAAENRDLIDRAIACLLYTSPC